MARNPLLVLDLPARFTDVELERAGRKWLGLLELGATVARTYATPHGPVERTVEGVRDALAELRDAARRPGHILWAEIARRAMAAPPIGGTGPTDAPPATTATRPPEDQAGGWPEANVVLGWRRP
jgi:hypothetical protein